MTPHRAFALVAACALSLPAACDSGAPEPPGAPAPSATAKPAPAAPAGPAERRILPHCDPVKAALAVVPAVGSPARLRLLWDGTPPAALPREIPVLVKEVSQSEDPPVVVIEIPLIPERDAILAISRESGHLRIHGEEIQLDPCSATLLLN